MCDSGSSSRVSETFLKGAAMFKDTKSAVLLAGVFVYSHGPAKPTFCRYRQGKLVLTIIYNNNNGYKY